MRPDVRVPHDVTVVLLDLDDVRVHVRSWIFVRRGPGAKKCCDHHLYVQLETSRQGQHSDVYGHRYKPCYASTPVHACSSTRETSFGETWLPPTTACDRTSYRHRPLQARYFAPSPASGTISLSCSVMGVVLPRDGICEY